MSAGRLIIHAEVAVTLAEFNKATRRLLLRRFPFLALIALVWGACVFFSFFSPEITITKKVLTAAVTIVIILLWRKGLQYFFQNTYSKYLANENPLRYRFDPDGTIQSGRSFQVAKSWEQIKEVEFHDGLYTIHFEYGAWILPSRAFSREEEERFEELLRSTRHKRYGTRR